MKTYHVVVTSEAKADLRRYSNYLRKVKQNPQAAYNLIYDFRETRKVLANIAGSLAEPESSALRERRLKRFNFLKHSYFLLFRIEGEKVIVTNMFHFLEDYENKLR